MAEIIFYFIILIVLGNFIVEEALKFINNRARKQPVPELLQDVYSLDKYAEFKAYKKETYRFSILSSLVSLILILIMLFAGFAILDEWLQQVISGEIIRSMVFFGIVGFASAILSLPFDYYSTFYIEQKYGFNTTTLKTFIFDKIKSLLLTLVIGAPVLYLVIWLYMQFEGNFWWMVWIVISVISIVFSLLYSNLIVPLFNKQTPLPEGELRDSIQQLAKSTHFNLDKIFVIDGSKRSTRANAYFTGFGSKKRIVLYDTLINTQSVEQITAVLAHEIGHYKKKHVIKGLVISILQMGLLLFLFSLIIESSLIYEAFGTEKSFHLGAIIFLILYSPVSFLLSLGTNYLSRIHEYEADDYAAEKTSASSLITSLKLLTSHNMSDLTPHPWYVKVYYSHPPLIERIRNLGKGRGDESIS